MGNQMKPFVKQSLEHHHQVVIRGILRGFRLYVITFGVHPCRSYDSIVRQVVCSADDSQERGVLRGDHAA